MAAGILASTLLLSHYVDRRERSSRSAAAEAEAEEPMESGGAFSLVFRNRYLLLLAFMLLFNNWVNSSGEYILGRIVRDAAEAAAAGSDAVASEEFIASFYSQFFAAVNLSGLLLQLFAVSRVVK